MRCVGKRHKLNVYIDDILTGTFPDDIHLHDALIRAVLTAFQLEKLQVKPSKCDCFASTVLFLGYIVGKGELRTDPNKIGFICDMQPPTTVTHTRSFLGMCNFLRRFVSGYSTMTGPLTQLLQKNHPFNWDSSCEKSFTALKTALTSAPVLKLPDFDKPFIFNNPYLVVLG